MDAGILLYVLSLLTVGGIYAIFALGLNVQWGFAGLFNVGIVLVSWHHRIVLRLES